MILKDHLRGSRLTLCVLPRELFGGSASLPAVSEQALRCRWERLQVLPLGLGQSPRESRSGAATRADPLPQPSPVSAMCFSGSGQLLASGAEDGRFCIFRVDQWLSHLARKSNRRHADTGRALAAAVAARARASCRAAAHDQDDEVDEAAEEEEEVAWGRTHSCTLARPDCALMAARAVQSMCWSGEGRLAYAIADDASIALLDVGAESESQVRQLSRGPGPIEPPLGPFMRRPSYSYSTLTFAPGQPEALLGGTSEGRVLLHDLRARRAQVVLPPTGAATVAKASPDPISALVPSVDGVSLFSATLGGNVARWDLRMTTCAERGWRATPVVNLDWSPFPLQFKDAENLSANNSAAGRGKRALDGVVSLVPKPGPADPNHELLYYQLQSGGIGLLDAKRKSTLSDAIAPRLFEQDSRERDRFARMFHEVEVTDNTARVRIEPAQRGCLARLPGAHHDIVAVAYPWLRELRLVDLGPRRDEAFRGAWRYGELAIPLDGRPRAVVVSAATDVLAVALRSDGGDAGTKIALLGFP